MQPIYQNIFAVAVPCALESAVSSGCGVKMGIMEKPSHRTTSRDSLNISFVRTADACRQKNVGTGTRPSQPPTHSCLYNILRVAVLP